MKTTRKNLPLFIFAIALLFNSSCKSKEESIFIPVLTTVDITDLTSTTAKSGGVIVSDGGGTITSSGVCWSTKDNPTILDSKTTDIGTGSFVSTITGISNTKVYYVRAYATNSSGTGYGNSVATIIVDGSGNIYKSVKIGTQTWLTENLKTSKYRTGEDISNQDTSALAWENATYGACCDYKNIPANREIYGRLYNWYAVNDSRNIAPKGWHVATDAEWATLVTYLGGEVYVGKKLKETGTTLWKTNPGEANGSGFNARPGGMRILNGDFGFIDKSGFWWTASENTSTNVWYWSLSTDSQESNRAYSSKGYGRSVRCVKDI
jgi:uncharacterized protein (TIGR02145 family)